MNIKLCPVWFACIEVWCTFINKTNYQNSVYVLYVIASVHRICSRIYFWRIPNLGENLRNNLACAGKQSTLRHQCPYHRKPEYRYAGWNELCICHNLRILSDCFSNGRNKPLVLTSCCCFTASANLAFKLIISFCWISLINVDTWNK